MTSGRLSRWSKLVFVFLFKTKTASKVRINISKYFYLKNFPNTIEKYANFSNVMYMIKIILFPVKKNLTARFWEENGGRDSREPYKLRNLNWLFTWSWKMCFSGMIYFQKFSEWIPRNLFLPKIFKILDFRIKKFTYFGK